MTYEEYLKDLRINQGKTVKEIAALTGRAPDTISKHLKAAGLTKSVRRTDIDDNQVKSLWDSGLTVSEIARELKTSHATIAKRLAKFDIICDRSTGIRRHYHRNQDDRPSVSEQDRSKRQQKFIEKAIAIHGQEYDYSNVRYFNSQTAVEIVCRSHGSFQQTPASHLQGHGCPKCADAHRKETCRAKYGVDYIQQSEAVKQKRFESNRRKYGGNAPLCQSEVREKVQSSVLKTYGVRNPAQSEEIQTKIRRTNQARRGVDYPFSASDVWAKRNATMMERYGAEFMAQTSAGKARLVQYRLEHQDELVSKIQATKRQNQTYNTSESEERLYVMLCDRFGKSDVVRQYKSDEYPFACDFYIKSRNMYIELNAFWSHGGHWFDEHDQDDIQKMTEWQGLATESKFYQNVLQVWTVADVKKRETARSYGLNYVVFWDSELKDARLWFDSDCPDGQDWDKPMSWFDIRE